MSAEKELARILAGLSRETRTQARASQAAFRAVELTDGPVEYYDEAGDLRLQVGAGEDGVFTITEVGAPPPPQPSSAVITDLPGMINIEYDGTFVDENRPLDLKHVEVHVGPDEFYVPDDFTQITVWASAKGGAVTYPTTPADGLVWVKLVAVNNALVESVPSDASAGEGLQIVVESDGNPPPKVTGLFVEGGVRSAFLSWNLVVSPDPVRYKVYGAVDALLLAADANHYIGTASANRFVAYSVWDDVAAQMVALSPEKLYYFLVVAEEEDDGPGLPSDPASGSPVQITGPDIAAEAVNTNHLRANAITADKFEAVLALVTEIQAAGGTVKLNDDGITVTNSDGTATTLKGGASHLAGTAELDETTINGGLKINDLDNYLNGSMRMSDGFVEPTAKPTLTSYRKSVTVAADYGYDRHGLFAYDSGSWVVTDNASGNGAVQTWAKDGSVGFPLISLSGNDCRGGMVRDPGGKFYMLGQRAGSGDDWFIERYSAAQVFEARWRIAGYSTTQRCALGYHAAGGYLIVFRVAPTGNSAIERWNTDGTSAGSQIAGPTWDVTPSGILFTDGGGLFATSRWVLASQSGGVRVYSTAMARITSEEWTHASATVRGIYFDAGATDHFFEWNGKTVFEYSPEPGASYDFALALVDNDPAGLGTATSLPGGRQLYAVPRMMFVKATVPKPPDNGNTDDPNTVAIYCGTPGGTLYRQSILPTSPAVGGIPTTYSQEYPKALALTAVPAEVTSGFAGRTAPAPGALESAKAGVVSGQMISLKGSGAWQLGEAGGDVNGKMIEATTSLTITDANYTGTITLSKIAGIVYCDVSIFRSTGFSSSFHQVATIPVGWRPKIGKTLPSTGYFGTNWVAYSLQFTTAGAVSVRESAANSTTIALNTSWPCAG